MGDQHMGLQARLMSQALRKLTGTVSKSHATVIFINQIRMKIGVMFGNPETTTRRQRAQVLRVGAARRAPHRGHQGRRRGHRQPHAREGGEEQGGAALPAGRVRHPLQPGHLDRRRSARSRRRVRRSSRRAAPGSPSRASASGRAARTRGASCSRTRTCASGSPTPSTPRPRHQAPGAGEGGGGGSTRGGIEPQRVTFTPVPLSGMVGAGTAREESSMSIRRTRTLLGLAAVAALACASPPAPAAPPADAVTTPSVAWIKRP